MSRKPQITDDMPVFDSSRFGDFVNAEREDEPGAECTLSEEDDLAEQDLNADLIGDWSYKPGRYPKDTGKVYDEVQRKALYPDGLAYGVPSIHHAAIFGADYEQPESRPTRIGPAI